MCRLSGTQHVMKFALSQIDRFSRYFKGSKKSPNKGALTQESHTGTQSVSPAIGWEKKRRSPQQASSDQKEYTITYCMYLQVV